MPRLTVKKEDLPPSDLRGALVVRFKIVSNSRNAMSEWSPVYKLYPPIVNPDDVTENFYDQGQVSSVAIVSAKTADNPVRWNVSLTWVDNYGLPQYDIYARWKYTDWTEWTFLDSVAAKSYSFDSPVTYVDPEVLPLVQTVPQFLDIAVTRSTYVKLYELAGGATRTPLTVFNTVGSEHGLVQ